MGDIAMRRLSDDALRGIPLGGKKIKNRLFNEEGNTCFLGSAGITLFGSLVNLKMDTEYNWQMKHYLEIRITKAVCPVHGNQCDSEFGSIMEIAVHLNNHTDMTREEIAYWVREQEDEIIEGRKAKEVEVKEEIKDETAVL